MNIDTLVQPNHRPRTKYVVVADNIAHDTSSSGNIWVAFSIKPQDRVLGEGLEAVVMERNRLVKGSQSTISGAFAGHNIITRGEIFVNGIGPPAINHGAENLPQYWQGPYFIDIPFPDPPTGPLYNGLNALSAIYLLLLN